MSLITCINALPVGRRSRRSRRRSNVLGEALEHEGLPTWDLPPIDGALLVSSNPGIDWQNDKEEEKKGGKAETRTAKPKQGGCPPAAAAATAIPRPHPHAHAQTPILGALLTTASPLLFVFFFVLLQSWPPRCRRHPISGPLSGNLALLVRSFKA